MTHTYGSLKVSRLNLLYNYRLQELEEDKKKKNKERKKKKLRKKKITDIDKK